jgi:iron complex outermembrane receptor protein
MYPSFRVENVRRPFLLATLITLAATGAGQAETPTAEKASPDISTSSQNNSVVVAANEAVPASLAADGGGTEVVTVTAQKRIENIQNVPQAITAVSGRDIAKLDIDSPNDLGRLVPNFSAQSSTGRGSKPRWFIRGMGSNDPSVNLESAVGVYQDEVYVGLPAAQNFPIFDLADVEVLRGPQGTLWGKNTTGGAVSFVSRAPSFDPSGYAKLNVGDYGAQVFQGAYGGGIVDDVLAARASFYYERGPTYAKNLYTGQNGPDLTDAAARFQLLARVGDGGQVTVNFHARQLTGGGGISYPIGINAGGADNNGFVPVYGTNPRVGDPYYAGYSDATTRTYGVTGKASWDFDGGLTLTSISNYDWTNVYSRVAPGSPPVGTPDQTATYGTTGYHQWSQELRLASSDEGPFTWLVGYNYFRNYFNVVATSATVAPTTRTAYTRTTLLQNGDSNAIFASGTYHLNDALALTIGLRETWDTKSVQETTRQGGARGTVIFNNVGDPYNPAGIAARAGSVISNFAINDGRTWNVLTYDVTPEYTVNENLKAYARFSRGFRAGAFNPTITTVGVPTPIIAETQPETLLSYEVGAKSQWLDGRLTFNVAAYHYTLKNIQLNVQQSNPTGIANATTSTIQNAAGGWDQGLEFEIAGSPIENLHLSSGISFSETRYKNFFTYQGSVLTDASGNQFYRTPKFSATFDANYDFSLGNLGDLNLDTDWSYRSHIYHNAVVQNDPVQETPGYWVGNVRLSYAVPDSRFSVAVYSNNVLNQSWKILAQVPNNGAYPVSMAYPRLSGVSVSASF